MILRPIPINDAAALELRHVDPARHLFRLYRMTECRTLFGEPCLIIEWGRIGRPPRLRSETFTSSAALLARKAELFARRHRHGYATHGNAGARTPI
jgi:predicted DNA-binding WGR domain protein